MWLFIFYPSHTEKEIAQGKPRLGVQEYCCEAWIEKFGLRTTVWHHETCQVITNGDARGQVFLSAPAPMVDYFSDHCK